MPIIAADLALIIERWAPTSLIAPWDRGGLQVGDPRDSVKGVLVALDVDSSSVAAAIVHGMNMIVAHHPLLFKPLEDLRLDRPRSALAAKIIRAGLMVYCAHTNLDQAPGGTDDLLAELLDLQEVMVLKPKQEVAGNGLQVEQGRGVLGFGRMGKPRIPLTLASLAQNVKRTLELEYVRVAGDPEQKITSLALCGGSGGSLLGDVIKQKADAFVTGDIKYHDAVLALEAGVGIIDAGHLGTEKHLIPALAEYIRRELNKRQVEVDVICHYPQELFRVE